jgi:hypothetical protein
MKSKVFILTALLGAGLVAGPVASARGGPGAGGGVCPIGNVPGNCRVSPRPGAPGTANRGATNPGRAPKQDGTGGRQQNPGRTPKQDGTGGPGKPANPAGPQDGSGPGPRR